MPPENNESWRQPWMKFWTNSWLHGSIHIDCTAEERALFVDLMAMANESRNRGIIQANADTPYPHSYLAEELHVALEFLELSLKKFESQGRIHENEKGIIVLSFPRYNPPAHKTGKRGRPPKEQMAFGDDPQKYARDKYGHLYNR